MKQFSRVSLVFLALVTSVSVYAVYRPGWQRPVAKATLIEKDALGHELTIGYEKLLTLHKMDGATRPTLISFTEELKVYCFVAPCPRPKVTAKFLIFNKQPAGCGSVRYFAQEQGNDVNVGEAGRTLELVDHSTRTCDDYKPYRWEVKLLKNERSRFFFGNPEGVFTPQ